MTWPDGPNQKIAFDTPFSMAQDEFEQGDRQTSTKQGFKVFDNTSGPIRSLTFKREPKFRPKRHAPVRGTIRDERRYTGGESGQVENGALIMNANVSPKLYPGTF
jgi:hypothetical protein